jgi:thiol-disulfide isomerase/thioredoxin
MKKLLLILTAACLLISCSNKKTFQISGTITNFASPFSTNMLYLKTKTADDIFVNIDSTFLKNDGAFILKGNSTETDLFFLADKGNDFFLRIFVEPGNKIKVNGSATDIYSIKIEGSETHALYDEYLTSMAEIEEKIETIKHNYSVYKQDESISVDDLEKIRMDLSAQVQQLKELSITTPLDFFRTNANSVVAAYLVFINALSENNSVEIENQLQLLSPSMKNKFITLTKEHLEKVKQLEVGKVFPNIELPDVTGVPVSLEFLRGKYVLVDFWATWCRPCVEAIPTLKMFYQQYHNKGFEIYSVSLDNNREAWLNGIENYELSWVNVSDLRAFASPVVKQLVVTYIPHTFLLDPAGVIIAVDINDKELEQVLSEMLK